MSKPKTSELIQPIIRTSPWIFIGFLTLLIGVIGFLGWASQAPISSASISYGKLVAESQLKTIQHLENGIIEQLHIKEGDEVKQGQLLFTLSNVQALSELSRLEARLISDLAKRSRLQAERQRSNVINFSELETRFPPTFTPEVARHQQAQRDVFKQRQETLQQKIEIQRQQIEQLVSSMSGLKQQLDTANESYTLVQEQVEMYNDLTKRGGYASKIQLLDIQRSAGDTKLTIDNLTSQIEVSTKRINEIEQRILAEYDLFIEDVNAQLEEVNSQISETNSLITAADDKLRRVTITSPVDGKVNRLYMSTVGGVVSSGEAIADILPSNDKLIVESLVKPDDIDVLYLGLPANIRLTAYSFRSVPPLQGTLQHISADLIESDDKKSSGYKVRIELSETELAKHKVALHAGMTSEVMILTGSQTLLEYLLDPLLSGINLSLREDS